MRYPNQLRNDMASFARDFRVSLKRRFSGVGQRFIRHEPNHITFYLRANAEQSHDIQGAVLRLAGYSECP